jgi:hypothetical protein
MQKLPLLIAMSLLGFAPASCKKTKHEPASASEGGTVGSADDDACVANCQLRARERHCDHPEGCRDACTKLLHSQVCAGEQRAFMRCFLKEPSEHWQCGDGLPSLDDQFCSKEQTTILNCLEKANTRP